MPAVKQAHITRSRARKILKQHRGSIAELARSLKVSAVAVTYALKGQRTSELATRIVLAAIRKAAKLDS